MYLLDSFVVEDALAFVLVMGDRILCRMLHRDVLFEGHVYSHLARFRS